MLFVERGFELDAVQVCLADLVLFIVTESHTTSLDACTHPFY